ncbi:unnamed protein product [Brachionus calyciflorus]|uniref:Uncharacterized protein n=1 Tax=Brachionus calyciflorus TaxID=104777 RepID=A0A814EQ31_9BILA|nr:unnamed protein product [Brachionus calyciflorus]
MMFLTDKVNNTGLKEHPANSIAITGLHDKVDIDLVFGLLKTASGFIEILVIVEKINNLENWKTSFNVEEEYALYKLAEKIRAQYVSNIPKAFENIEKSQERQRYTHDER